MDCPPVDTAIEVVDQPFDAESIGDSEDADLFSPVRSVPFLRMFLLTNFALIGSMMWPHIRLQHGCVMLAYDHVRHSLPKTAGRQKRLYDVKAVNRKFSVG